MTGITVNIGANIGALTSGIGQASSQISSFVSGANSRLQSLGDSFSSVGQKLSIGLSVPLGLLSKQLLENGGGLESLKMGLKSIEEQQYGVGKSSEYAAARYNEYVQLAKLPGIGLKEAVAMSISLRSVGFSADDAKREIVAFGNALALVGKGKNELNGVALQIQQLSGKTSGFGADLRVIKEYAPQVGGALLKAFGTIDTEAIAKTGVTGKQVIEKITAELEKLPRAGAGMKNAMENVSDSIFITTGRIGVALNKALGLNAIFDKIGNGLANLAAKFEELSPTTQKFIGIVGGLLVIVPPLLIGLGAMVMGVSALGGVMLVGATAIKGFVASSILGMTEFVTAVTISFAEATTAIGFFSNMLLLNPIGAVIAGVVLLGAAMYGLSKIIDSTAKEVTILEHAENQLNDVKKANYATTETEIAKTTALVDIIKSNVRSIGEKQSALSQLIAISPKYFEGLTIEAIRSGQADVAIKKYTESIKENAITKGAEAKISKLAEQLINEKDAYDEATAKAEKYRKESSNKQISAGMGVFIKKGQFSKEINEEINDAYSKIQKTDAALKKISEFIAVRTVKTEGGLPEIENKAKGLTEKELKELESSQKKAEKAREEYLKNTEKLLSESLKIENSLITDKYARELAQEKQAFTEKVKLVNDEKASIQAKYKVLESLEKEHQFNTAKIISEGMKGRTATSEDGGLQGKGVTKFDTKIISQLNASFNSVATALNQPLDVIGAAERRFKSIIDGFQQQSQRLNLMWASLGKNMKPSVGLLTDMLKESIPTIGETVLSMAKTIDTGAKAMLSGFGKIVGAMAVGKAGIKDMGSMLLEGLGSILVSLGEQLIASSISFAAAAAALALALTPAGAGLALAAGIGLVAIGSALSSSAGGGSSSSGGGSSAGSYSQNYSSLSNGLNGANNAYGMGGGQKLNVQIDFGGEFVMRRNEMVAGIRGTQKLQTRTYGG